MRKNRAMKNKQISILIVDNDTVTCKRLVTFLDSEYRCTAAATAEEAIVLLNFCPFDLIIIDRELPGVSGLALCQFLQRTRPDTAIILMSERITPWQRSVAESLGVFACIGKPCNLLRLPDLIESELLKKTEKHDLETSKSAERVFQTA
jgi:DNA-binding NtrC family response regulator